MTKEERQKYKELTKALPKILKDKIKKYKFKKKDFMILNKLDIENPIIRINTAFKGCSSLEKISVLPRIYHN